MFNPDPTLSSSDPLIQALNLLLHGAGYNFYSTTNQLRSDDLLVRQAVSGFLTESSAHLAEVSTKYQRSYIPTPSRQAPLPPAEKMERLRDLRDLCSRYEDANTRVLTAEAPGSDFVWARLRQQPSTLRALLEFDQRVLAGAKTLADATLSVTAAGWDTGDIPNIEQQLRGLEAALRERSIFLHTP